LILAGKFLGRTLGEKSVKLEIEIIKMQPVTLKNKHRAMKVYKFMGFVTTSLYGTNIDQGRL